MTLNEKRVIKNLTRNKFLDRELDFLPSKVSRDEVREIARTYGPLRRRSVLSRMILGFISFLARYSAPFVGLIVGAEYAAAKALYPLIGNEERFGDSLRLFLGEDLSQKVADMNKVFEVTGTLVAATPKIITCALYGAVIGIAAYYISKWVLLLCTSFRRRVILKRKIRQILE
jgi:hypothetical protein